MESLGSVGGPRKAEGGCVLYSELFGSWLYQSAAAPPCLLYAALSPPNRDGRSLAQGLWCTQSPPLGLVTNARSQWRPAHTATQVVGPRHCPRHSERLTPPPSPTGKVTALGQAWSHMTQEGTLPPRKITAVGAAGKSQALGDTGLEDKLTSSLVDTHTATYPDTHVYTHTHHVYLYTQ